MAHEFPDGADAVVPCLYGVSEPMEQARRALQPRSIVPEPPSQSELETFVLFAPTMNGGAYLTLDLLRALWAELRGKFTFSKHR